MNLFASFAANNLLWLLWYNLVVGIAEVVAANKVSIKSFDSPYNGTFHINENN